MGGDPIAVIIDQNSYYADNVSFKILLLIFTLLETI